jgi:hypothetical protein
MRSGDPGPGRSASSAAVVLLLAVLACSIAGGVVAGADVDVVDGADDSVAHASAGSMPVAQSDDPPIVPLQDQPDADATVTRIALAANGSATWTIEVRTRLTSADDVAAYEAFQERFRSNRTRFREDFEARMTGVVQSANASLDRPMAAEAFSASTRIEEAPQRWGVVTYAFRWEGFAATDGDRVIVGDVFGDDFFIEENSVLEVVAPDGHSVETVEPSPDDRSGSSVAWEGPATFGNGEPRVVATSGGDDGVPLWWIPIAIAALFAIVALGIAWRRWRIGGLSGGAEPGTGSPDDEAGTDGAPAGDRTPLTDEDHVRQVLAANGGRCKQSRIVEELEWSKSKTSRVLSRMAADDRVEKLRIGRENVIELTDEERTPAVDHDE